VATKDITILTRPTGNAQIQFSGSDYSSIALEVLESGSLSFTGASGSLFSISDTLSGSLMSVNDISGLPIFEVFSDDRIVMGSFNQNTLVVTGSQIGFGTNVPGSGISNHFQSSAGTLAKFETTSTNANPDVLIIDGDNNSARASLQIQGNAGAIESLFVASNGSIGMGTITPTYTLDVVGNVGISEYLYHNDDTDTYLRFEDNQLSIVVEGGASSTGGNITLDNGGSVFIKASQYITFSPNNTELMRLTAGGNVGVGTTNPYAKLTVEGSFLVSSTGDTADPSIEGHLFTIPDTTNDNPDIQYFIVENNNLEYGMRWFYDGGANSYSLYRHNASAAGVEVQRWFRGSNDVYFSGAIGIGVTNPTYALDVAGQVGINEYIYHNGDTDTYFRFETDQITISADGGYSSDGESITMNAGNLGILSSGDIILSTGTGGTERLRVKDAGVYITGSLDVSGKLTAEEFHTEHVSSSIIYISGSTKFGDSTDDRHSFTGSHHVLGATATHISQWGTATTYGSMYANDASNFVSIGARSNDDFRLFANGTDVMTLKVGGFVGIGTTSPDYLFSVYGGSSNDVLAEFKNTGTGTSDYAEIHIDNDNDDTLTFGSIGSNYSAAPWSGSAYVYTSEHQRLWLKSGQSDGVVGLFAGGTSYPTHLRMLVDSTGVGIGTTDPSWPLHIHTATGGGQNMLGMTADDGGNVLIAGKGASDDAYLNLYDGSGNIDVSLQTAADSYFRGGQVGIGLTEPTYTFHVLGNARFDADSVSDPDGTTTTNHPADFWFTSTHATQGIMTLAHGLGSNTGTLVTIADEGSARSTFNYLQMSYDTNGVDGDHFTFRGDGVVFMPSIGAGVDNSVVILDSDGSLRTDEIDSRVWGSTLVDGSGTTAYNTYWSDANTLAGEQYVAVTRGGSGVGTLTGMLQGNGTGNFTGHTSTAGHVAYWSDANTIVGENALSVTRGGTGLATIGTNYILTGNGTSAMTAESGLTYGSSLLSVTGGASISGYIRSGTSNTDYHHLVRVGSGAALYVNQTDSSNPILILSSGTATANSGNVFRVDNDGSVQQFNTDVEMANSFISGVGGQGWRIDYTSNGSYFEVDNLHVRNTLSTAIFQKEMVKASNGYLWISDSGVISGSNGSTTVTFETAKSSTFANNDELWFKDADPDSGTINSVKFLINGTGTVSGDYTIYNVDNIKGSLANLHAGGTAVRISGGSLLLDASSTYSPFMDVFASSGSTVVRTGNIEGITSNKFGALSGYGFWASGSVYLEGSINATSGYIGDWVISTDLTGGNISLSPGDHIAIGATGFETGNGIWLGNDGRASFGDAGGARLTWDGTNVEIHNDSGAALVTLGASNVIAGWTITTADIGSGNVTMSSAEEAFIVRDGTYRKVQVGNLNGEFGVSGDTYGIILGDGTGDSAITDVLVELSDRQNVIAGWKLTPDSIGKSNVTMSEAREAFIVRDGTYERTLIGNLNTVGGYSADEYGFILFDGTGTAAADVLVELSTVQNIIAGWTVSTTQLSSGNMRFIPGDAIEMGATTFADGNGIWLGDGGTARFGNASAARFQWDGTDVSIYNSSNALLVQLGATNTIAGWGINTSTITSTNTILGLGYISLGSGTNAYNSANRTYIDGTNNRMSIGTGFRYASNALIIDGSATIGGWVIAAGSISDTTGTYDLVLDSSNSKIYIGTGTFDNANTPFYVDSTGQLSMGDSLTFDGTDLEITGTIYASAGSFTGNISATSGNIGNWNIVAGELAYGTDIVLDATNRAIYINGTTWQSDGIQLEFNSGNPRMYVGNGSGEAFIYDGTALHLSSSMMAIDGTAGKIVLGGTLTDTSDVVVIDGASVTIYGNDTSTGVFVTDNQIEIKSNADVDKITLTDSGMSVTSNSVTRATFYDAGVTIYGDNATTYTSMTSAGMSIVDNSVAAATFTSTAITLNGATTNDQVVINASGMLVKSNNVTRLTAYDAGVTVYGDNATTYTSMTSAGMTIVDNSFTQGTFAGGVVTLYGDNATTYTRVNSSGLTIVDNSVTVGTFTSGTITLYGASTNDRMVLNNTGMSIYSNNVLRASALDAGFKAYGDAVDTYSAMTSTGMSIYLDGAEVAQYGANATINGGTITLNGASTSDQVVITNAGMLVKSGGVTRLTAYDAGVTMYGDNATTYASVTSAGMTIVDNSATKAVFGANTTITGGTITLQSDAAGGGNDDRLVIGNASIALYTNDVKQVDMNDAGINIGPAAVAGTAVVGNIRLGSSGAYVYGDATNTYTSVTSAGLSIVDNGVTAGTFTSAAITLNGATTADQVVINASGMLVKSNSVTRLTAYDAGVTAYGDNATTYTSMTSAGITIVDNSITTGTFTSGTVTLYGASANDRIVLNASGLAIYSANVLRASAYDAGFVAYGDAVDTYAAMTSTGMSIYLNGSEAAQYGANATINGGTITLNGASTSDQVVINNAGMLVKSGGTTRLTAYDAGVTAYGDNATTYTSMTSAGITIVDNSVTTGTFTSGTVTLYGASTSDKIVLNANGMAVYSAGVLRASAYDAGFVAYGDAVDTYAAMTSTGMSVFLDGTEVGQYGSTVTVGKTGAGQSYLYIDASGNLSIKNDTTDVITLSTTGDAEFTGTVYASAGSFTGNISATSGNIGNWNIVAGELAYGTDIVLDATNKRISLAGATMLFGYGVGASAEHGIVIDSSNYWYSNGKFSMGSGNVTWDGATLSVTGEITATTGTIGGFTIGTNLTTLTKAAWNDGNAGVFIGSTGIGLGAVSTGFSVSAAGALTATSATITGTINASAGFIGGAASGWAIGSALLSGGSGATYIALDQTNSKIRIGAKASLTDANTGVHLGSDGIALGASSVFKVTNAGVLTATSATITGAITATSGTFTGTIDASGGDFTGYVNAGNVKFGVNAGGASKNGIYMDAYNYWYDASGFAFKLGGATNYISGNGSTISIKTTSLDLQSTNFTVTTGGTITAVDGTIGGWTLAANEIFSGDIHIDQSSNSIYIDSGSRKVVDVHTGPFDTNTEITELLGDPSFETGTTGWTLAGTLMTVARVADADAYAGSYSVTGSDVAGNPYTRPSSSIEYTKTGITGLSIGDVATYKVAVKHSVRPGTEPVPTWATLMLEGYAGSWSTLKTKSSGIAFDVWSVMSDTFTLESAAYTQFRFTAMLHGYSKNYYTSLEYSLDDASLAVYNGGNITELCEDGLLIFKDYDNIINFGINDASVSFNAATINELTSTVVMSPTVNASLLKANSNLTITTNTGSIAPIISVLGATGLDSDTNSVFYSGSLVNIQGGTGGKGNESVLASRQSGSFGGTVSIIGGTGGWGGDVTNSSVAGAGGIGGDVNI
jgi:hypothetical protein